jgi:hypothetical protein
MPLFGPLEGSEGTILIPEGGSGGELRRSRERGEEGAGLRGFGPQIASVVLSGVLWAGLLGIREAYPLYSCIP